MARWQEQEDGTMRNFSIIELAQEKGEERMRGRVPFIPQEAKRRHLDELQVSKPQQMSKSQG
jgi:hypothetical protein